MNTTNRRNWYRSIVAKIFVVSFICIHVPLIALLVTYGIPSQSNGYTVALVVLGATLLGTIACLATMWWLTRPLRHLALAISRYRAGGAFAEDLLNKHGEDEIAIVTRAVCGMVGEIAALAERVDGQPGRDPLTGLLNGSAAYAVELDRLVARSGGSEDITVAVFELERTDAVDRREVGDMALVAVGDLVRQHFFPRQVAARVSHATFVLLFPGDQPSTILDCCEALRCAVGDLEVEPENGGRLRITFGLAFRHDREEMADLIHRADMALFRARDTRRSGLEVLRS